MFRIHKNGFHITTSFGFMREEVAHLSSASRWARRESAFFLNNLGLLLYLLSMAIIGH